MLRTNIQVTFISSGIRAVATDMMKMSTFLQWRYVFLCDTFSYGTDWGYVDYVIVDCAFTYLSLLHLFFEYSGLIALFSETTLYMAETSVYSVNF
jgi:hypothetical protein